MRSDRTIYAIQEYAPAVAALVAITATLGSLYYSEVAGYIPCTLCWYQRILMYPLVAVTLVGLISRDHFLPRYVLPLSLIGIFISSYHYLLQLGIIGSSNVCTTGVPCSGRFVNWFGFITIPLQALTAFTLITLSMLLTRWAHRQTEPAPDNL
ncbi:MAG: disulfide oxidoreductase [Candidatus Promineifilaceae bacterium]|nr:disulfide oxidoreductase [Candidatus Promineifilaceae bacterium]